MHGACWQHIERASHDKRELVATSAKHLDNRHDQHLVYAKPADLPAPVCDLQTEMHNGQMYRQTAHQSASHQQGQPHGWGPAQSAEAIVDICTSSHLSSHCPSLHCRSHTETCSNGHVRNRAMHDAHHRQPKLTLTPPADWDQAAVSVPKMNGSLAHNSALRRSSLDWAHQSRWAGSQAGPANTMSADWEHICIVITALTATHIIASSTHA